MIHRKMMMTKWTCDIEAWIRERCPLGKGSSLDDFVSELNETFKTDIPKSSLKSFCRDKHISLGIRLKRSGATYNHKPIGSERENLGYVFIKVAEPNKWKPKQVYIFERLHGEKIDGKNEVVIFLDGNKRNFEPDNLFKLTRQEHTYLNRNFPQTDEPKEKLCYIALMKYRLKAYGKAREQGLCNDNGAIREEAHQRYLAVKNTPEYRKHKADYAREYLRRMKRDNPEKYEETLRKHREYKSRKAGRN
ncbi:MAG: HNH endonuclease [Ruminococcus flavefaciens]|nr:HNH endonuclease [Ruminococcus flavefaciens]